MCRKIIISILCFTSFSEFAHAQESRSTPSDPAKTVLIEEMIHLTQPDKLMTQFLEQYKTAFSKGFEESFRDQLSKRNEDAAKYQPELSQFENQMFDIIADRMSWDKLKPKFVAIYDETFSKQELADIVAFYKTPSGQASLQKMPVLISKGSQIGQTQMNGALEQIQRLTAQFLDNLSKAHPHSVEKQ